MNHMGMSVGGIALAIGMVFAASAVAGPTDGAQRSKGDLTFFLADPELGLAGVYNANGVELYFEARRSIDVNTGAPGALSLRVVDGEARTLALAGASHAKHWVPQKGEFAAGDGMAYSRLLSGLGRALGAADLHVALAGEKSALADLAIQAAGTPTGRYPARVMVTASTSFAPTVMQTADFYQRAAKDIQMTRQRDGMLEAKLGNGVVFMSTQTFVPDEPDTETGEMGRIDTSSLIRAADGYVLASELGSDAIPEGWADAMEKETGRGHHALATDFGSAATALNALAYSGRSTPGVALSNPVELAAMHRLAESLTEHLLPVRDEASRPTVPSRPDNRLAAAQGLYQTYIQVWRKSFVVIAEHSGTRVGKWKYNSSTSSVKTHQGWISFCNHGTCAAAAKMTHKCTFTGPRLSSYRKPSYLSAGNGNTCSTPYWAIGRKGHHNCHDDSSVQVRAVRGQSYSVTGGRCGDSGFHGYAPTCDAQ